MGHLLRPDYVDEYWSLANSRFMALHCSSCETNRCRILTTRNQASRTIEEIFEHAFAKGHDIAALQRYFTNELSYEPSQLESLPYQGVDAFAFTDNNVVDTTINEQSWLLPPDIESYLARHGIVIGPGTWFVRTKVRKDVLGAQYVRHDVASMRTGSHDRNNVLLEPLWHAENYDIRKTTQIETPLQDMTTSTTPVGDNLQSANEFNEDVDALPFQWNQLDWLDTMNTDFSSNPMTKIDTLWSGESNEHQPTMDNFSTFFHQQNSSFQPALDQLYSTPSYPPQELGWLAGNFGVMGEPSLYTGTTDTTSTQQETQDDSPLDVTVDVTQLMYNLVLSVKCLGYAPAVREADIGRALRASILVHS